MPDEYRRLIFSDAEVVSAIFEQSRKTKSPIPSGKMKYLTIGGDKLPYIQFAIDTVEGEVPFKIDGSPLVASLIRYCVDKNIPIPQKATKSVSAKDQRMIMDIKL